MLKSNSLCINEKTKHSGITKFQHQFKLIKVFGVSHLICMALSTIVLSKKTVWISQKILVQGASLYV